MSDDRTSEFMSLARSLPQTTPQGASSITATAAPHATGRYAKAPTPSSDLRAFHKTAADISKDIAATSAMLTELTQLVRNKSLFEQDSTHMNTLVLRIKTNIENLNARLDQAGVVLQQEKRRVNTQAGQEATNLVGQLKEEFVEATAGFKKVLQQRTNAIKETSDAQHLVYGGGNSEASPQEYQLSLDSKPPVYSSAPSSATSASQPPPPQYMTLDLTSGMMAAGESTSSSTPQLPRPAGVASLGGGGGSQYATPGGMYSAMSSFHDDSATPLTPLDIQRMEQESQQTMQLIPDQTYLRERADAMSTVETNIVELGAVFNKLAVMVSEHREMVTRVEDNVDDVEQNVNLSMQVLNDTLTNLRTNRALYAKVFGIIVAFIIMFIVFFA